MLQLFSRFRRVRINLTPGNHHPSFLPVCYIYKVKTGSSCTRARKLRSPSSALHTVHYIVVARPHIRVLYRKCDRGLTSYVSPHQKSLDMAVLRKSRAEENASVSTATLHVSCLPWSVLPYSTHEQARKHKSGSLANQFLTLE